MKQYLVFAGDFGSEQGGMDDFKGDFDTFPEARQFSIELADANEPNVDMVNYDWVNIFDQDNRKTVYSIIHNVHSFAT